MEHPSIGLFYAAGPQQGLVDTPALDAWVLDFVELQLIAQVQPFAVEIEERLRLPSGIGRIAYRLAREWKHIDGAVVLLSSDHFLYAVHVLRMVLGPVGKPVVCIPVLEGGQVDGKIALRSTLLNGVQAAGANLSGVMIHSRSELLDPRHTSIGVDGLPEYTPGTNRIGYVDFGLQFDSLAVHRSDQGPGSRPFAEELELIQVGEVVNPLAFSGITTETPGVIVESFGEVPVSVSSYIPEQSPALLLSPSSAHLLVRGRIIDPIDAPAEMLAAAFTVAMAPVMPSEALVSLEDRVRDVVIEYIGE